MDIAQFPCPSYIIDERLLRNNLMLIKSVATKANIEIILAFKSFAMWKSFPIFREYIDYSTASSLYEARLAFEEFGNKAHTYSPAYIEQEFEDIMKYSSHITFNSINQFDYFYSRTIGNNISCGIRINPEYSEVETELYNPCAKGSRFGVTYNKLPQKLPEGIEGFHCHTHCESSSYALERTLKHIEDKFSHWFNQIKWLNLGGGHLMTHKDYDIEHLIKTLQAFKKRYPHLDVILEPGSAFTWQTGVLTSKVIDIVEDEGIKTALLNVSFTCHMPDCLEMPYQPEIRGATIGNKGSFVYRLGGNSCLSGDYMGDWSFSRELKVGDILIFEDMIHYTTVKTNMFNGVHHPAMGIWTIHNKPILYKQFVYADYRNRMS